MKNKISFFDSYSDASGGAPKSMLSLAKLLQDEGFEVDIFTCKDGTLKEQSESSNIKCQTIDISERLLIRRKKMKMSLFYFFCYIFDIFRSWYKCLRYLSDIGDGKLCFNDIRCFLFYLPIALIKRKNLIWYVRINDRVKFITTLAAFLSSKVIIISSSCEKMFTTFEKTFFIKKFYLVHTGFPVRNIIKDFVQSDTITLGFIGVLSKRKNLELVIDSLSLLNKESLDLISLIIVGSAKKDDVDYELEMREMVSSKGLDRNVSFVGHQNDVSSYYESMDVVLMTSYSEGLPRVLIEGLSHGCFVITTNVDGVVDIVKDDSLGIVVEDYSSINFSQAIIKYIENRSEIVALRQKRINYIESNFSEKSFISNFINSVWG